MKNDTGVSSRELEKAFSILSKDLTPSLLTLMEKVAPYAIRMGINTVNRISIFMANCAHESDGFMRMEENLRYSPRRLMQVWPSRFKSLSAAREYAYAPQKLANKVYNGRMGNRLGSDDGWRYRGSGFIQLTGRNNFELSANRTGLYIDVDPDELRRDKHAAIVTAIDYFVHRRYKGKSLLEWADLGSHRMVCRAINGGTHGLTDRKEKARLLQSIFLEDEGIYKAPLLRKGDRGGEVKYLQYRLRKAGYKIYKVDGIFGRGTERTVKQFQKDHGLVADGIIGGNTQTKLNLSIG